jgi:hypothetical protein
VITAIAASTLSSSEMLTLSMSARHAASIRRSGSRSSRVIPGLHHMSYLRVGGVPCTNRYQAVTPFAPAAGATRTAAPTEGRGLRLIRGLAPDTGIVTSPAGTTVGIAWPTTPSSSVRA